VFTTLVTDEREKWRGKKHYAFGQSSLHGEIGKKQHSIYRHRGYKYSYLLTYLDDSLQRDDIEKFTQ